MFESVRTARQVPERHQGGDHLRELEGNHILGPLEKGLDRSRCQSARQRRKEARPKQARQTYDQDAGPCAAITCRLGANSNKVS